jgi:hypothetical protein
MLIAASAAWLRIYFPAAWRLCNENAEPTATWDLRGTARSRYIYSASSHLKVEKMPGEQAN